MSAVCPAYCSLWRHYPTNHRWDAANAPPGVQRIIARSRWQNIETTPISALALAEASSPPPWQRCASHGIRLSNASAPPLRRMHWLHIPKTGSSFGTTIMHRGCPRIHADAAADDGAPIVSLTSRYPRGARRWCDRGAFLGNLNGHEAWRYAEHHGRSVALFRNPRARLLSECSAVDGEFRRAFGTSGQQGTARRAAVGGEDGKDGESSESDEGGRRTKGSLSVGGWRTVDESEGALQRVRPSDVYAAAFLREFLFSHGFSHAAIGALTRAWNAHGHVSLRVCASLDGVRGCQAKMLLGVPCAAPLRVNATMAAEARRRVRDDLALVGLTERFDETVCLFHAIYGGAPRPSQFINGRARRHSAVARRDMSREAHGKVRGDASHTEQGATPTVGNLLADPEDESVYAEARARFERDLAAARANSART